MNRLLRSLTFPCLLAAVLTLWMRWQPLSPPDSGFVLEMRLVSPTSGLAWLRFNTGDGWNFRDTRFFSVTPGPEPRTYRVALPPGAFKAFRLLPPEASEAHALAGARILDPLGAVVGELAGARFAPAVQTIPFALDHPLRLTAPWEKAWLESALDFAVLTAVFALAGALLAPRAAAFAESARARWSKAASWFHAHPKSALLGVAILAVAASCHPVVFFGKSFVSPNNGILCLYDVQPTLPGASAGPCEQPGNSDVLATLWAHLPYSVVTHDAVLRDGELPLWNRYVMGGLTLLGQGQSMPGDPLFWMTVCADGAAWAWDLRFLLSKVWFALGIGLLVWQTSRHLGVAALLTFSSAFLGFFAFRFNHPAFFSVCSAPWILLCWLRAAGAPTVRGAGAWALAAAGANWLELNSGTAKEAAMLILTMNGAGALVVLLAGGPQRWKKGAVMAAGCAAFLAVSAPLWVVFLEALQRGFTLYDSPAAYQLPAGLLVALFDDLFGRQLIASEWHVDPALNFFVLLGVLWLLADFRRICADRTALAVALGTLPPLALVFAVIPPEWLVRLPLVKSIIHVDDTFIAALIAPLFILAGYGLRHCAATLRSAEAWRGSWGRTLALLGALAALYLGTVQAVAREGVTLTLAQPTVFSPFFRGYAAVLLAGVALLPWFARRLALGRGSRLANALCVLLFFSAFHFRHGMWLATKFDTYVMNPQARANLQAVSPAVEAVRARLQEPGRTLGFGENLRPGFNVVTRLEGPAGADAVVTKALAQWYEAAGIPWMAMWWPALTKQHLAESRALYDAMNVRYYLGSAADAREPAPGLQKILSADLEVFESETAWPRAFFTDRAARYSDPRTLGAWIKGGDGRPFAAVLENEALAPALPPDQGSRSIAAARDYRLTANKTAFTIDAPHAGVAVLNESFVPDDFRARVNGRPAPVFRVNHIFKGVALPAAGTFRIEFEYWPHLLTPALYTALGGVLAILASLVALLRTPRRSAPVHSTPAAQKTTAAVASPA